MAALPFALAPLRLTRLRSRWRGAMRRLRRLRHSLHRARRALNSAPRSVQILVLGVSGLSVLAAANLVYHVVRKPTEMFFPLATALNKLPAETWAAYGPLFRAHSTATVTPELLAALAQVEGAGNPVAHTYWRWRFSWNPFEIYRPASSAVGMYQMTDGTFAEAKHYCIHHHQLVAEGPWWDMTSCWFNSLYMRVLPGDAVELTAAYLDRKVTGLIAKRKTVSPTPQQRDNLAAMIHLCGTGPAEEYLRRGFRLAPGKHCGDQDVAAYLARVGAMKRQFVEFARADAP